jgi:hypothetical protein
MALLAQATLLCEGSEVTNWKTKPYWWLTAPPPTTSECAVRLQQTIRSPASRLLGGHPSTISAAAEVERLALQQQVTQLAGATSRSTAIGGNTITAHFFSSLDSKAQFVVYYQKTSQSQKVRMGRKLTTFPGHRFVVGKMGKHVTEKLNVYLVPNYPTTATGGGSGGVAYTWEVDVATGESTLRSTSPTRRISVVEHEQQHDVRPAAGQPTWLVPVSYKNTDDADGGSKSGAPQDWLGKVSTAPFCEDPLAAFQNGMWTPDDLVGDMVVFFFFFFFFFFKFLFVCEILFRRAWNAVENVCGEWEVPTCRECRF